MPLVDVGANVESYLINGWTGRASSNDSYYSTNTPMVNTIDKLGSITNNSSDGFGFTASQRVKVDFSFGSMSSLYQYVAITKTSAPVDPTTSSGDNKKIVTGKVTTDNDIESVSASCVLESGESLWISVQDNGTLVDDNYAGSASIVATKDYSHTNLAHIIKPAVCRLTNVLPQNTANNGTSGTAVVQVPFNTVEGESWFLKSFTASEVKLSKGYYKIKWQVTGRSCETFRSWLYKDSASVANYVSMGTGGYSVTSNMANGNSYGECFLSVLDETDEYGIAFQQTYESAVTGAMGQATNFGENETYSNWEITKLK